ncbi:hypothetical protein GE115_16785 [Agromyces sp. CFH 90414]|uniref:Cell division protein FtsL n=1 Tax=Agromyces agglutinans TaxID=2662258 RepID=A0A6I2F7Q3_9MICO|nr:hypothetical protein [Agromyces agglutinans]MRG61515.1 hypothetical protein [Agromyces agglutinans]
MSALPAQSLPAPRRRGDERPHRRLRPVPETGARTRPRLVYAVIALGSIGLIVVAQLLFSVAMTEGAYEIDAYELKQIELAREEQKLREQIDALESPQSIAQKAEALGMVPNSAPVFLQLSNGAVFGQPTAADGAVAGSSTLVPNALIDDVPDDRAVAGAAAGQTGAATQQPEAGATAPDASPVAPVPPAEGLPTPATH